MVEFNLLDDANYPKLPSESPESNSADLLTPFKLGSGLTRGQQIIKGTLIIKDTTTNRIVFGQLPDNTYGLVISKPGVDVLKVF